MCSSHTVHRLSVYVSLWCVFFQGDILFRNWRAIFSGDGVPINARIPIYSFDGRDVLADPFWSVVLVDCLLLCLLSCQPCLNLLLFICQAKEEHLARIQQQGCPSGGQTLWDMASVPHVRHGPVIQPDLRSAPGPANSKLFQRVHCPLHWDPQKSVKPWTPHPPDHSTEDLVPATVNVKYKMKRFFFKKNVIFSTPSVLCIAFWWFKFRGPHLTPQVDVNIYILPSLCSFREAVTNLNKIYW